MTLLIIAIYLSTVVTIGLLSHRLFRGTGEDYFIATRTIGPFILLMSLFGTHMTSFALLGASAESYHQGITVLGLMASPSAIVVPAIFYFVGARLWRIGKSCGYVTQVEFFRNRWNSDLLGVLLFFVLVLLMIPYLLIGVMGGGITLFAITGGQIPEWIGSLIVCLVVWAYVTFGGLRGTSWANTFQTLVFMTLGGLALVLILKSMGGPGAVVEKLADEYPQMLVRGNFSQLEFFTYTLIPFSAGMFPHLFMHWLSARNERAFRIPTIFYPLCVAIVWVSSTALGMAGKLAFPNLAGPEANSILIMMIESYAPEFLAGLLAAGVLAAVMSSLDSQVLAVGTMFTRDIVQHYGFHDHMSERLQVIVGRLFVGLILALCFLLAVITDRSIFRLGIWCFTGFAALFPLILAALFWKRSTRHGAIASLLTVVILWTYYFLQAGPDQHYTVAGTGIMPVFVITIAAGAALIVVSLLTTAPGQDSLRPFFSSDLKPTLDRS